MENKKILFIADGCHPSTQGGIQTFGRTLQKMFCDDIIFLANKTKNKKIFKVNNVQEISRGNFLFKVVNKLLKNKLRENIVEKEIKKINPDVCVLRSPENLRVLKNIHCKKILVQHINFEKYFESYYNSDYKLLEKSKKELELFITTSFDDKKKLNKDFKFPLDKIKVIRHSCEINILKNSKTKNKNLIMVARLDNSHKRFDLAIRAMKKLPDFKLKIYGSGTDKKMLEKIIEMENINNVFLCGSTDKIKERLDEAGIFIMTSDFEGYPITSIEAMRRGLPIILRNTFEGASDIVIDNGILLEKDWQEKEFIEGIKKIYHNYGYYSKNSLKLGQRHDLKLIKKEWKNIFYK